MKTHTLFTVGVGMALLLVGAAISDDQTKSSKAKPGNARFEQLKKLAGEWTGQFSFGGEQQSGATVTYRVISSGGTVMETLFPGTDHEMVTMYHRDGSDVLLTHYCAAGNQPRMKLEPTDQPKRFVFKFLDGTNLDPKKDLHMHDASIEFVSDDQVKSEWVSYQDGKPLMSAKFDLKRKPH